MCVAFLLVVAFAALSSSPVAAATPPRPKLEWHYYKTHNICRDAELYVRNQVKLFWKFDKSITAKLLRLVYSDCFITVSTLFVLPFTLIFHLSPLFNFFSKQKEINN